MDVRSADGKSQTSVIVEEGPFNPISVPRSLCCDYHLIAVVNVVTASLYHELLELQPELVLTVELGHVGVIVIIIVPNVIDSNVFKFADLEVIGILSPESVVKGVINEFHVEGGLKVNHEVVNLNLHCTGLLVLVLGVELIVHNLVV